MTATYKSKMSFQIQRIKGFWKVFRRSKRGMFGIGILVVYISVALAAPLLTPNDPVSDYFVSGDYSVPSWFSYFPGGEKMPQGKFGMVAQPGFPTADSLDEWNFTKTSPAIRDIAWDPTIGNGSVRIKFTRDDPRISFGTVKAHLFREFAYPYDPPKRFRCSIAVLTKGAKDVSVRVQVIIKPVEGNQSVDYSPFWDSGEIEESTTKWIIPSERKYPPVMDSYNNDFKKKFEEWMIKKFGELRPIFPEKIVFPKPANYTYDIFIFFYDDEPGKEVETTVYIDDVDVEFYGTAYGVLGTDHMGLDLFAQLVYGARISLFVGLLAAVLSVVIGLMVGLISGYVGRIVDEILMRFTDMLLVLPGLPLLIVLIAVLGASIWNLIILIGILGWMGFARQVRSMALSLKERPFVEAAKAVGASKSHIIMKHVLPNVMSLVYVALALSVPSAILSEAALSWLGLFDPTVISWGKMLYYAQWNEGITRWWWMGPPGISIALVSLSFILLGYALDEVLNPKLRVRR